MRCLYHTDGVIESNPADVNVWANFYNTYNFGTCEGGVYMRMYMTASGNWTEWSQDFGC
jgi:hypothetical protein